MNLSSKAVLSIAAVAVITVALLAFKAGMRSRRAATDATLSAEVEKLIGKWTVEKVPLQSRVLNLVLGDVRGADEPLSVSEASPSGGWLSSLFGGAKPPTAEPKTELAKRLSGQPGFITWTFDGFSTADEKTATQDIMLSIIKAHDAGAEINVVAQGDVGGAVIKAIKSLEGQVRNKVPVGANKVILLGMNSARLKALDPVFFTGFKRPGNLFEWASVNTGLQSTPNAPTIEFSDAKHEGAVYPASSWLGSSPKVSVQLLSDKIIGLVQPNGTMELFMNLREVGALQAKAAEDAAAPVSGKTGTDAPPPDSAAAIDERHFRSVDDGRVRTHGEQSQTLSATPQDSLSMVKGDKEIRTRMEAQKGEGASDVAATASRRKPTLEQAEAMCARCCADVGGAWQRRAVGGQTPTERGCCQGGRFNRGIQSCSTANSVADCYGYSGPPFACNGVR